MACPITNFTGIHDPYQPPQHPDLRLTPADGNPETEAARVLELLDRS